MNDMLILQGLTDIKFCLRFIYIGNLITLAALAYLMHLLFKIMRTK